MRTSNKILLGGFLATLLIVIGIHMVLYAKIRSGHFVVLNDSEKAAIKWDRIELAQPEHILLKGLMRCTIIPSDGARLHVFQGALQRFNIRQTGDSLIVEGKFGEKEYEAGSRLYAPVVLYLPQGSAIRAIHSDIDFQGSDDSAAAFSQQLELVDSHLFFTGGPQRSAGATFWDSLSISAYDYSKVVFAERSTVKKLRISLYRNSTVDDGSARFDKLNVQLDTTSSANLHTSSIELLKQQQ